MRFDDGFDYAQDKGNSFKDVLKKMNSRENASIIKNNKFTISEEGKIGSREAADYENGQLKNAEGLYNGYKKRQDTIQTVQKSLNTLQQTDYDFKPLKNDGIFGTKTQYTFNKFWNDNFADEENHLANVAESGNLKSLALPVEDYNLLRKVNAQAGVRPKIAMGATSYLNARSPRKDKTTVSYKIGDENTWMDISTVQGVGVLPDGRIVGGENMSHIDGELLRLKVAYEKPGANKEYISELAKSIREKNPGKYTIRADKPISSYTISDVTKKVNGMMMRSEYENQIPAEMDWIATIYPKFYSTVEENSEQDWKNTPEFEDGQLYIYEGEIVSRDALGNIGFGFLGKVYGIPDTVLYMGAGVAQILSKNTKLSFIGTYMDDPRDTARIKQGIEIYDKWHENWSKNK